MIRFTHNIWMGVRGDYLITTAPKKAMKMATTLTVNWNWRNFLMQSKMFLPYFTAVMMELKLSSSRMIPAASLATCVPAIPIANPISAFFKAGASLVPSPVIATTLFSCFKPVAKMYLSSGDDLARTRSSLVICSKILRFLTYSLSSSYFCTRPSTSVLNYLPSMTMKYPGSPFSGRT